VELTSTIWTYNPRKYKRTQGGGEGNIRRKRNRGGAQRKKTYNKKKAGRLGVGAHNSVLNYRV